MKDIWLIDATTYKKSISDELRDEKITYFRIKSYLRRQIIGRHSLPTQKTFSIGLLRIATLLERKGYNVKYYHLEDFKTHYSSLILETPPNIVAFGCVCPTIPICNEIAKNIKSYKIGIITAVGGSHINVALNKTMCKYTNFDKYVYGFDRVAVSRLIDEAVEKEFDYIPYVDYSILPHPLNDYDINIFSTLGCAFNCKYCQDGKMPYFEYLLDGGLSLIKNDLKPYKLVHFFDSSLGYSKNRLLSVCNALSSLKHKYILSCDMRAEFISKRTINALVKAGFREVRMGLETVDLNVLIKNGRDISPNKVIEKVKLIRECSDLYITLYTVSGLPGTTLETYKNNKEIYKYLLESRSVDEIKNAQYVPYPIDGVDPGQKGIVIRDNNWENYDRQSYPVYETKKLTRQQIWEEFLDTAKVINKSWINGLGFDNYEDIKDAEVYPEYIVNSYLKEGKDIE